MSHSVWDSCSCSFSARAAVRCIGRCPAPTAAAQGRLDPRHVQVEMLQLVDVEEGIDNSETTLRAFLNSVDALHGADSFAAYASQ